MVLVIIAGYDWEIGRLTDWPMSLVFKPAAVITLGCVITVLMAVHLHRGWLRYTIILAFAIIPGAFWGKFVLALSV